MTDLVRAPIPADEDALFDLLMALAVTNNSFGFEVSPSRVREHIEMGTRQQGGLHGVIDAPDKPGVLAGSVGMVFDRWWFSEQFGLAVLWLFVRPEYRQSHYADALVEWAKQIRASLEEKAGQRIRMVNSVVSQDRLDTKLRFWRRSGPLIGGIFEIG